MAEGFVAWATLIAAAGFLVSLVGTALALQRSSATRTDTLRKEMAEALLAQRKEFSDALLQLRAEMTENAEKRLEERERQIAELHRRIDGVKDDYVRRSDLDGHLGRIERQLSELTSSVKDLVKSVAGLQGRGD